MKPTGKFNPLGDEIFQAELSDLRLEKSWVELTVEEKADVLSYLHIGYLNSDNEAKCAALYQSLRDSMGRGAGDDYPIIPQSN